MQEKTRGYLRDTDKPASLDNLDFDTRIYLKRAEAKGGRYEFGALNWRDGSVSITIERPDAPSADVETAEEWRDKRQWYIENAPTSTTLFEKGVAEGYLTWEDDWLAAVSLDQAADYFEEELQWKLEEMHEECIKSRKNARRRELRNEKRRLEREGIRIKKTALKRFQEMLGRDFVQELAENPWLIYEGLKGCYGSNATSSAEYDERMGDVVLALGI